MKVLVKKHERRHWPGRAWAPVPVALAAVAVTAACAAPYGGASTTAATQQASQGTAAVVSTASTGLGTVVVNSSGRTVYEFGRDTGSTSTCTGGCAAIWPPVLAPATLPASLPGITGPLGSTTRTDGGRQLTIAGHPVYTYSGDGAPGDTNGQGLQLNGGVWHAVAPSGSPVTGMGSPSSSSY